MKPGGKFDWRLVGGWLAAIALGAYPWAGVDLQIVALWMALLYAGVGCLQSIKLREARRRGRTRR